MLIDIVNPGWAPVFQSNLTEDIPGYLEAPANALAYSWEHFIAGHLGRLGTRDDIALHQQYMADIADASRNAIDNTDLTRYFEKYPDNPRAAFRGGLEEVVANAAAPVIEKYTGVLAAADVFTDSQRSRCCSPSGSISATDRGCTPDGEPAGTGAAIIWAVGQEVMQRAGRAGQRDLVVAA